MLRYLRWRVGKRQNRPSLRHLDSARAVPGLLRMLLVYRDFIWLAWLDVWHAASNTLQR
jgi:hypothetical protein